MLARCRTDGPCVAPRAGAVAGITGAGPRPLWLVGGAVLGITGAGARPRLRLAALEPPMPRFASTACVRFTRRAASFFSRLRARATGPPPCRPVPP